MARGKPSKLKSFTERDMFVTGIVGTIIVALIMLVTFEYDKLPFFSHGKSYSAVFSEAGQLASGNEVIVSGAKVGTVSSVGLDKGHVLVKFSIDSGKQHLGTTTTARVTTLTLLGKAGLELDPAGPGTLADDARIPLSRTTSQYDITNALNDLGDTTSQIDIPLLAKSLSTVASTFQGTPAQLKAALQGISRVSTTIASRDASLQQLLSNSADVTALVSSRNAKITQLLGSGAQLLGALNARQDDIVTLLSVATELGNRITTLVKNNSGVLGPALKQVDQALALLNRNKSNIQQTIDGLKNYSVELGEAVSSGPFFDAYIQNLTSPTTVIPVLSGVLGK